MKNGAAVIQSGTQISGQLQSTLDTKNAKVGDQVVLKATNAVKQNGQTVVEKGSRLIGHVTEVQQRAKNGAGSRVGVVFDTLQQGGNSVPISAVITSVFQAQSAAGASVSDDDMMAMGSTSAQTTTSTRSSGGGGGLLGGVVNSTTQTVGGVANTAGQTVNGVTNTAGQTVGSTTRSVGGTLRGLQISQSTDASASGGSVLSLSLIGAIRPCGKLMWGRSGHQSWMFALRKSGEILPGSYEAGGWPRGMSEIWSIRLRP